MATNLQFIKSVSSFDSVTSVDITDCFSNSYDVYMLSFADVDIDGAGDENIDIRFLDSGGSSITASEYAYAGLVLRYSAGFSEIKSTSTTAFTYGAGYVSDSNVGAGGLIAYIYNPYDSSSYTFLQHQQCNTAGHSGQKYIGVHTSAEQITGIQIRVDSGTIEKLSASMYGVK
tara:strand:+ start:24 stop:542 length:519 start_codon:yes stop_codon:yes gene_type:complete